MKNCSIFGCLAFSTFCALSAMSVDAATRELTVSPDGLSPLAARDAIRVARAKGEKGAWTVHVKPGLYPMVKTLVFEPCDSDVTWLGEKGARFSGGQAITGWTDTGKGWWEAPIPKGADGKCAYFEQMWVDGRRADRSRFPDAGQYLRVKSCLQVAVTNGANVTYDEQVVFSNGTLRALGSIPAAELEAAQMCVVVKWSFARRILRGLDAEHDKTLTRSNDRWASWKPWSPGSSLIWFENLRSAFDKPGEWFYDLTVGKVLYRPLPDQVIGKTELVAPVAALTQVISFNGQPDAGKFVENVVFQNIAIEHSAAPGMDGKAGKPTECKQLQAASFYDGAITLEGARKCRFDNCLIRHTGNYGMRFNDGCVSNVITASTLEDLGAGGIWLGERVPPSVGRKVIKPVRARSVAFNRIEDCIIRHAGYFNPEGTGVAITHASDNKLLHCDIYDIFYTGVSVGWVWGFRGSVAQRNEVGFNRIWDLGHHVMSDMGGVYTLGTSYGTHVHDNIIHDVWSQYYGGWALYTDEGSEGIVMERNLCWNTTDGGFHQHYGTGCIIRNNIFAWNKTLGAVRMYRAVVQDIPCTLHFINNIVLVREGPLAGRGVCYVGGVWANNVWWNCSGQVPEFHDVKGWDAWCKTAKETGSIYADPLFVGADKFDFRLQPNSPAFKLGFKAWDYSKAGVRSRSAGSVADVLTGYVEEERVSGVVSVLSDADYHEQFDCIGWAELPHYDKPGRKMTPDTLFAIFSMTKTFTGAAIMCAIDEGKISLDDEVSKYIPEFANVKMKDGSKPKRPLTIRDMTTHVTGFRGGYPLVNRDIPLRELARYMARQPLHTQPGEQFSYSTATLDVAGACLEVAVGKPFEVYLKEKILDPLGMKDTTFTPNTEQLARLVCAYNTTDKPLRAAKDGCTDQLVFPKKKQVYPAPGGGLFSTPRDMIRFSQMLAHHGEWKDKRIISQRTFNTIFSVKQTPVQISQQYTCGSWIYGDWFGHEGAMRTDQRANLKTGHSRVFFIQTENRAGSAFFQLKNDWHVACDRVQGTTPTRFGN